MAATTTPTTTSSVVARFVRVNDRIVFGGEEGVVRFVSRVMEANDLGEEGHLLMDVVFSGVVESFWVHGETFVPLAD